jgi:carboxyl-terminal processing protease
MEARTNEEAKAFENLFEEVVNPGVQNIASDLTAMEGDDSKKARNKDFVETTSKDVYIREAVMIVHDIINLERRASRN